MAHTPGPWKKVGQSIYGSGPNSFICEWSGTIADAHLIVAAPDLLDACKRLVEISNGDPDLPWEAFASELMDLTEKVEKIVAKAEGR